MSNLTFETLLQSISGSACAYRTRFQLQPADGPGGKVFPPTHLDGKYAFENRVLPDLGENPGVDPVPCVLLDSVQSHANRCEDALQLAVDQGRIKLPLVVVDFSDAQGLLDPVDSITSLTAPHRLSDAILRDSQLDGTAFRQTELGRRLDFASLKNATPLFDLSPHSLLFGLWDSTGPRGGLGVKFQRVLVGEIVGCNVQLGMRTASRIDPLQIVRSAEVVGDNQDWKPVEGKSPKGAQRPSEINHGNIPPTISEGGVTMSYASYSSTLSLPAIRRLRFPVDGELTPERDDAGRAVIAALGLLSVSLATQSGFDLRSRCLLWPSESPWFELLDQPGETPQRYSLDGDSATELFHQAVQHAKAQGLPWREDPVVLKPAEKLVKLLSISQRKLAETSTDDQ